MNIILLGAPGAGKGSVSELLTTKHNYYHLSTGDALRQIAKEDSELAHKLNDILKSGQLVSDDIVNEIVKTTLDRIDQSKYQGIIFDGYPRTKKQAEYLKKIAKIDQVLFIDVPDEVIENRIINRRLCSKCGKIYNLVVPELKPKKNDTCDVCGALLIQRKDDTKNVIAKRLQEYYKEISPLMQFYAEQGLLRKLNGTLAWPEWKALIEETVKTNK